MADRISARRGNANAFFVTLNAGLLAVAETLGLWTVSLLGIFLTAAWWFLLGSYRKLNRAKFNVIQQMEERLPVQPFKDEWAILKDEVVERELGKRKWLRKITDPLSRYAELSVVEQLVLLGFGV